MSAPHARCVHCGGELVVVVHVDLDTVLDQLDRIERLVTNEGNQIMSAVDDLAAVDQDLADAVTGVVAGISRLEADFAALEAAVSSGDAAAVEAEVAKVRAAVDALKAATAGIDTADPAPTEPSADQPTV